jgi:hypothetical protein
VFNFLKITLFVVSNMGDNSLSQTVIVVENAGHPEANGTYRFEKMYRGAGYFSRDGVFENKEV